MTTSSDKVLLRFLPVAVLLAAVTTVGLTLLADPFGYSAWPKPPTPKPVERLVQVDPVRPPVAPSTTRTRPAPAEVREEPRRPIESPARRPERLTAEPAPQGEVAGVEAESPDRSGPSDSSGPGSGGTAPDNSGPGSSGGGNSGPGHPVAGSGNPIPDDAHAKPTPRPLDPEHEAPAAWREDARGAQKPGKGHGRGRGHGRGHGRHGHRGPKH